MVGQENTKQCSKCGEIKAYEWFYKQTNNTKDGLNKKCITCVNPSRTQPRHQATKIRNSSTKKNELEEGRVCTRCNEYKTREHFYKQGERKRLCSRCKNCSKEVSKEWAAKNRGAQRETYGRAYNGRRKEHLKRAPDTMPEGNWHRALMRFYDWKCCRCWSDEDLQHDHVIPISWFCSTHSLENSQVLCAVCNRIKRDYHRADYREGRIMTNADI